LDEGLINLSARTLVQARAPLDDRPGTSIFCHVESFRFRLGLVSVLLCDSVMHTPIGVVFVSETKVLRCSKSHGAHLRGLVLLALLEASGFEGIGAKTELCLSLDGLVRVCPDVSVFIVLHLAAQLA